MAIQIMIFPISHCVSLSHTLGFEFSHNHCRSIGIHVENFISSVRADFAMSSQASFFGISRTQCLSSLMISHEDSINLHNQACDFIHMRKLEDYENGRRLFNSSTRTLLSSECFIFYGVYKCSAVHTVNIRKKKKKSSTRENDGTSVDEWCGKNSFEIWHERIHSSHLKFNQ